MKLFHVEQFNLLNKGDVNMLNSFNRLFSSGNKSDKQSVEQFNESEVIQLPVEKIIPNQFQPRTIFEDEKIDELAQTLKTHGIIQPIVVRQLEDEEQYEVIAGERRLRAAKVLEWETISSIIRNLTDTETASVALIENIQREQLSAIEEASAYVQLLELHELTQEALAKRLGKSQSTVANRIRLLKLIPEAQEALLNKKITERHGRTLLKLNEKQQKTYLDKIVNEELNVKELEELVEKTTKKAKQKKKPKKTQIISKDIRIIKIKEKQQKNYLDKIVNKELNVKELEELVEKTTKKAKPKKKPKKAQIISKDIRIATNTIKESLKMIENTGINVESEEEELEDYYQVTIRIKK